MKKSFQRITLALPRLFILLLALALVAGCSAPAPGTQGAGRGGAGSQNGNFSGESHERRIELTQEAALLLQEMITAYQGLNMAELDGTIWARFETEDGEKEFSQKFNSAFHQPNQFKHVLQQDLLIGSSGDKVFMFQKSANAFCETNMPPQSAGTLPAPLPELLQAQNPSLLMALAKNPLTPLGLDIDQISRVQDVTIGGLACPVLSIKPTDADYKVLLLLDPETKLLKRLHVEIEADHLKAGAGLGFKSVLTEVNYTTIQTAPDFEAAFFDWTPPEGSERIASMLDEDFLKK